MESRSLYERLGKSAGISKIVDDIVTAHAENARIRARFLPILEQPERVATIKNHLCMFLEAGSGGPGAYQGRDMRTAHRGMNVSAEEYMAAVDDILMVLRRHGVDEQTQKDVLAISWSLKGEIVHV